MRIVGIDRRHRFREEHSLQSLQSPRKAQGGWRKVVVAFGDDILLDNGEVDRPKLGQIVFANPDKRQLLNRLLAPYISSGIYVEVLKLWMKGCKIIVLDVPLLFEAKMDKWTKPIIVVWVDSQTQLQRLMARDGTTEEEAKNRISAQMSLDLKRTKADIVIENTGSLEDLKECFSEVLILVKKPLTWTEFGISRDGALLGFVSILFSIFICRKIM
ncbi:Dephospho-CoA kinase [Abeliophyllum distichum]|uniref:Dephospho-CoA kinase n=1 Tax=Abeliophyllum distichum TaxID=126358 RepID=A0ABD1RBL8_9LAMI